MIAYGEAIEDTGFERVIEAGLGEGPQYFLGIDLHTFPAARDARTIWLLRFRTDTGEFWKRGVARLVGIEGGVVSGVLHPNYLTLERQIGDQAMTGPKIPTSNSP